MDDEDAAAMEDPDAGAKHESDEPDAALAPAWVPLDRSQSYAGKPLEEWAVAWARWHLAQNDCDASPFFDADGSLCSHGQDQANTPVFFLEAGEYVTHRDACVLPSTKAVLVPLMYSIVDGVQAAAELDPREFEARAKNISASARDLVFRMDGKDEPDLYGRLVGPVRFDVVVPPEPNFYTCQLFPGVSGDLKDIYIVGVFVLLPPPTGSFHLLEYGGTYSDEGWDEVNLVKARLRVE